MSTGLHVTGGRGSDRGEGREGEGREGEGGWGERGSRGEGGKGVNEVNIRGHRLLVNINNQLTA